MLQDLENQVFCRAPARSLNSLNALRPKYLEFAKKIGILGTLRDNENQVFCRGAARSLNSLNMEVGGRGGSL